MIKYKVRTKKSRQPPKPSNHVVRKVELQEQLRKKIAAKNGDKKICLTMIVKNESNNMERLLNSVKSIIDMISIVDTGSTDNTEEVIIKWGKANNIPTTVHHEPFKNFSYNRTHSVREAKKTYPEADYLLLLDADFVWEVDVGHKFDKKLLIDHKYLIEQYNKMLSYWNVRLLSAKVDWECVGLTHEYWTECSKQSEYAGEIRTAKIHTLRIDDREDGGCKSDKFERDERLLRQGLEDPSTPAHLRTRYKFYLAQTLKDVGRHEESIEWYKKRAQDKGWQEEIYYSMFQVGFNHEQLGWRQKHAYKLLVETENKTEKDWEYIKKWNPRDLNSFLLFEEYNKNFKEATKWYMNAHEYRKSRAESLYYLTRMYRLLGQHEDALNIALVGNKIPYPSQDTLFVEPACHTYLFDFEISIVAYYIPNKKNLGGEAIGRLLNRNDLPEDIKKAVENNSRAYL